MIFRLLLLILVLLPQPIFSQNDMFRVLDSAFNARVGLLDDEFGEYTRKMDEDFVTYLKQSWEQFETSASEENNFDDKSNFVNVSFDQPVKYPKYWRAKNRTYSLTEVLFYEKKISLNIDKRSSFTLTSVGEAHVAEAWGKLMSTGFGTIIEKCDQLRSDFRLNDWGIYLFVTALSDQVFKPHQINEKKIFVTFVLAHAGYDVKLGRLGAEGNKQTQLMVLIPFKTACKRKMRTSIDGKYYCIDPLSNQVNANGKWGMYAHTENVYTYRKNFKLAKSDIDLSVNEVPLLGSRLIQKTIQSKSAYLENVKIVWRNGLTDFYDTYPNTVLSVYVNAPLSNETKQSLKTSFAPMLAKVSKRKAVELLLYWYYHAFDYKMDAIELPFFSEQMIKNRYSDCEDRAIFFARIVKDIVGLDVILIVLDKDKRIAHVAVGVCFDENTEGDYKMYKNRKYIVCDPSFKECKVGYLKTEYAKSKTEVIELIK